MANLLVIEPTFKFKIELRVAEDILRCTMRRFVEACEQALRGGLATTFL